jgi:hypothetical protein
MFFVLFFVIGCNIKNDNMEYQNVKLTNKNYEDYIIMSYTYDVNKSEGPIIFCDVNYTINIIPLDKEYQFINCAFKVNIKNGNIIKQEYKLPKTGYGVYNLNIHNTDCPYNYELYIESLEGSILIPKSNK